MPSAIDSLYSAGASIAEKVQSLNLRENINAGVNKFSDALQSNIPSLSIKSVFSSGDLPTNKQSSSGKSPAEAKSEKQVFAGALAFPSAMKYYTKFTFFEYDKKVVNQVSKDQPTVVIILPRPNDMHEAFGVNYAEPALGPIVGNASDSVIKAIRSNPSDVQGTKATSIGENMVAAGEAGILNALKKGGFEKTAALGSMGLGVAPNPNLAVLFENIGLRDHNFSYKFAPTSQQELQTLKNIIRQLKTRMLPGMDTSMLFTFPDVCDIEFGPTKDNPYKIKRCVMTALNVNYTPMGSPAFFKTGDPVMVEIQMTFKETSPFTRADLPPPETQNQSDAETERLARKPAPTPPPRTATDPGAGNAR